MQVIKVFIASPGDLHSERRAAKRAVRRINELLATANDVLFEPIGWEDLPAGTAERTQELINPAVEQADVFIGLMGRRFGTPNGVAASGTAEEYGIAKERFDGGGGPAIKLYFKRLPNSEVEDPDEQLAAVLEFRASVSGTSLFQEFTSARNLGERIENDLASLIHSGEVHKLLQGQGTSFSAIPEAGDALLYAMLNGGVVGLGELAENLSSEKEEVDATAEELARRGLLDLSGGSASLAETELAFLTICDRMLSAGKEKPLLLSDYFARGTERHLMNLVSAHFHCDPDEKLGRLFRRLARVSPRAANHLLFEEEARSIYRAANAHGSEIGQMEMARRHNSQHLLHQVLLMYGLDIDEGSDLHVVDGMEIELVAYGVKVAAVRMEQPLFTAESVAPIFRVTAGESIERGKLVAGGMDLRIYYSCLLFRAGEFQMVDSEVRAILAADLTPKQRAAVLNLKALRHRMDGRLGEARELLQQAHDLDGTMEEVTSNLAMIEDEIGLERP
ncbi:MAG: DUF4062 domain-containing protein [Deltaproteobacteria bacterium]|nr:DUF4062 domain-containing protein [Deltaproteobacteria bacterium]